MTDVVTPPARVGYNPGERVIEARNVDVAYGEVQVVFDVSLHVDMSCPAF